VLVPLVVRDHGLTVLLTQRADHLNDHAGQVSFPGGRQEPFDADAIATALREAQEEVGLAPSRVEILGALPDYLTGTGFCVTPVIGLVHPPFALKMDELEVAEVFEVPLAFLMDPANHEERVFRYEGGERRFFAMPYPRSKSAGASGQGVSEVGGQPVSLPRCVKRAGLCSRWLFVSVCTQTNPTLCYRYKTIVKT
jgi:8-oxo-dGTP pyrophosphatase MutT (NUDIX family)